MAQQNIPNEDALKNLQSQQSILFSTVETYKAINKEAGIYNAQILHNTSQATALNKEIQKSADLVSKAGKEIVLQNQVRKASADLEASINKLIVDRNRATEHFSDAQKDQVKYVKEQFTYQENLAKEISKAYSEYEYTNRERQKAENTFNELASKGLDTQEATQAAFEKAAAYEFKLRDMEEQRLKMAQDYEASVKISAEALKDQQIGQAVLLDKYVEVGKKSKEFFDNEAKNIAKSNAGLQRRNFLQTLFQRLGVTHAHNFLKDRQNVGTTGALGLGAVGVGVGIFAAIVALMTKASTQVTNIARGMSLTRDEAVAVRESFFGIAKQSSLFYGVNQDILVTETDILETQLQINKAFGTGVLLSAQQLSQANEFRDILKLSEEAMKGVLTYSLSSGKELDDIRDTVLGTSEAMQIQGNLQLDNKEVLEDVFKTTGAIRANFKGNLAELTKAVTKSKLLGISLDQVQKTSEGLLDFESSISNQLEAELLTGRSINVEKARAAALAGDTNTVMEEVTKQLGTQADFNKLNVLAQESLAKTFGMTRGELSDIFFQQQAMAGLAKTSVKNINGSLIERYNILVKQGMAQDDINKALGKEVAARLEQQSASERFAKIMERVQDIFSKIFDGERLEKFLAWIGQVAEHLTSGGSILGVLSNSGAFQAAGERVQESLHPVAAPVASPVQANAPTSAIPQQGTAGGNSLSSINENLIKINNTLEKGKNLYIDTTKAGRAFGLSYTPLS